MDGPASLAILGFLLGVRHAVDPDHVVAVSAIAAREASWRRATLIGALWGVGHTATILLLGGGIIIFRLVISPRVGLALEFGVAVMLVFLGVLNVIRARPERRDAAAHGHVHASAAASAARPVLVGMMHGLAGSAAVALLILAMVRDTMTSMTYLVLFGVGTIVGMMLVTTLVALPTQLAARRAVSMRRWLTAGSGAIAIGMGLLLAFQIAGPGGLFAAQPVWTPR
jgi:high-affinity nickel permease